MIQWFTIIVSFISFLLGLLGNLFVQWWTDRKRLNRIKGVIKLHLKDIILVECVTLKLEFGRIIDTIEKQLKDNISFKSCRTFDGEIYKANNPSDYYKIYGADDGKFDKLVSIYAMIFYLKENMPMDLYSRYLNEINENLYNNPVGGISINEQWLTSGLCEHLRSNYIAAGKNLMEEVDVLIKLINEFLEK